MLQHSTWCVMSMVSFDCYSLDDKYRPVFVGVEPAQDELIVALGDDYEAQSKMLRRLDVLKDSDCTSDISQNSMNLVQRRFKRLLTKWFFPDMRYLMLVFAVAFPIRKSL